VDANILTYHFQPHPIWGLACSDLLQRIENRELAGFTSTNALSEVPHRLLTIEASIMFGWPFTGIGNRLRAHPAQVQKLTAFRQAIDRILQGTLQVLKVGRANARGLGLLRFESMPLRTWSRCPYVAVEFATLRVKPIRSSIRLGSISELSICVDDAGHRIRSTRGGLLESGRDRGELGAKTSLPAFRLLGYHARRWTGSVARPRFPIATLRNRHAPSFQEYQG
jgi:hypothetical protein